MNGKRIRFQAKCMHCGKVYAALSTFGTGTLKRHLLACSAKMQKCRSSQSLMSFNPDGSLGHWEYSPEVARTQLCHLIARLDLPSTWVRQMLLRSTLRFLTTLGLFLCLGRPRRKIL